MVLLGYLGFRSYSRKQGAIRGGRIERDTQPADPLARTESPDPTDVTIRKLRAEADQTISALKNQNGFLLTRLDALERQLAASQGDKQALEQTMSHVTAMNAQLASQNEQNVELLAQTKAELEKARADRTAMET